MQLKYLCIHFSICTPLLSLSCPEGALTLDNKLLLQTKITTLDMFPVGTQEITAAPAAQT